MLKVQYIKEKKIKENRKLKLIEICFLSKEGNCKLPWKIIVKSPIDLKA